MSRPRRSSTSEYKHITQRGMGRRIIFEDSQDMSTFLKILSSKLDTGEISILAWCLMDNHFHLLVEADSTVLSKFMQRVSISYAQYFNGRHGHVGKVFQNRFHSTDINNDPHLLSTIRYIHRNALESGAHRLCDWPWSSYRECIYAENAIATGFCNIERTLDLFGGKDEFIAFHEDDSIQEDITMIYPNRPRVDDAEAKRIIEAKVGKNYADRLANAPKQERDQQIRLLKLLGLSVRQIERLTGIGRGIISRA